MKRSLAAGGALVFAAAFLSALPQVASAGPQLSLADRALAHVSGTHSAAINAAPGEAYQAGRSVVDPDGTSHVRFTRTYQGLPVLGGDFVVHSGRGGEFRGATSGLTQPLTVGTRAGVAAPGTGGRLVVDAYDGTGRLAWETVVSGAAADGQTPSRLHVVTDAGTGKVIRTFDEVKTLGGRAGGPGGSDGAAMVAGTGNSIYSGTVTVDTTLSGSTYSMVDPSHGNGSTCDMNQGSSTCTTFTDADNVWGNGTQTSRQSAGVDAHYGAALTYDYFKNVHGRNGIFGNGAGVPSRVHFGSNYINAFWNGSTMTYGDGQSNQRPLVAIDVAGHEMGHGVTDNIIPGGLTYSGESGGLNESASDIWGNMVEFYGGNANDPGDYTVGEKINIFGNGNPLRWMYDPKLDGSSKNCWYDGIGNIDVHYSSGVGNLAYFFLAEGSGNTPYGNAPLCAGAQPVTGLGRAKAEKIWYRAMDIYFTSSTKYVSAGNSNDSRAATLSAATDLYGYCSAEYKTVQAAWAGVNVAGEDLPCTTPAAGTLRDYNGDGRADLALTGGAGWSTIPVAFSNGNGTFNVTNSGVANFPGWAAVANVQAVYGDFNGDGRADIALSGGAGWSTVPVAFSNGNGTFSVTNSGVANFPSWATVSGAKLVAADFNGDGRADLALTGGAGWSTVPVAFSNGNGTFNVTNSGVANFPSWAATANVKAVAGDFNGDGRSDLALTGGAGWSTVPVAFSNGNGTFSVTNSGVANFPSWAATANVKVAAGDYNGDGRADLALSGGAGWSTVPVAFSNGNGTFSVTNSGVANFPSWATVSGAKLASGDFNGDGRADLALAGGAGWSTVPVAFSNGNGTFTITNSGVANFPGWAATASVKLV
ncbi:M4 family metallopeptidase [Longispora albida]|uniref:M4 family metallopeptidase n=1 Tax=Longispora albida TaxID=203523 RepID=UPI00039E065F|nr:M4 family metallopeptidase [Longispora albida]